MEGRLDVKGSARDLSLSADAATPKSAARKAAEVLALRVVPAAVARLRNSLMNETHEELLDLAQKAADALQALIGERDRAFRSLRALQEGAGVALQQLGVNGDGPVADFLCAIHREAVRGMLASDEIVNESDHCTATDTGAREDKGLESARESGTVCAATPTVDEASKYQALPFTAGPWSVSDIYQGPYIVGGPGYAVAQMVKLAPEFAGEQARNAILMAAALDLLEAVQPLARLEIPRRPQGNAGAYSIRHADIARAIAAVARATGEPA